MGFFPTQLRLNPAFVNAIENSGHKSSTLAAFGQFPTYTQFSMLLHTPRVSPTPLTISRLQIVADVVGFSGPIFWGEDQPVSEDLAALWRVQAQLAEVKARLARVKAALASMEVE
jgi:hypothetical protein